MTPEQEAAVAAVIEKVNALSNGTSRECYVCGREIARMEKIGRCVYAHPCGHRLWQGTIPASWKGGRPNG